MIDYSNKVIIRVLELMNTKSMKVEAAKLLLNIFKFGNLIDDKKINEFYSNKRFIVIDEITNPTILYYYLSLLAITSGGKYLIVTEHYIWFINDFRKFFYKYFDYISRQSQQYNIFIYGSFRLEVIPNHSLSNMRGHMRGHFYESVIYYDIKDNINIDYSVTKKMIKIITNSNDKILYNK